MKRIQSFPALIAAILLYLILQPYYTWSFFSNELFLIICNAILAVIFALNCDIKKDKRLFLYLIFIILLFWPCGRQSIFGIISTSFCLFLPFGKEEFNKSVYKYFLNIYSGLIAIACVVWGFVLLEMVPSIGTMEPLNELKTYYYNVYPFCISSADLNFFRFCGPFDEPGLVGTFSAILICIEKFNFRKWQTWALLLSGLLSLSMYFFLVLFLYLILHYLFEKKKIVPFFVCISLIGVFYLATKDNEILSERLWNRMEWDSSEKKISGDTRMHEEAQAIYKQKQFTSEYWFGVDDISRYAVYFEGSSSYKVVVLRTGMIFFVIYLSFFLILARKYKPLGPFLLFAMVFLSAIYQRPGMFGLNYFFLFSYFARYNSENIVANSKENLLSNE